MIEKKFPKIFSIETALGCDLKYPECAIGGGFISRKKGFMNFENFKIIADKAKPYVEYMYLHLWGEPLLNPDIYKMISYASKFTKTNISTNANNLDKNSYEKLIKSDVTDLIVSIDGVSQKAYEKYRIGGNAKTVYQNLEYLAYFNKKHNYPVNINPQFIVFKHNEDEIEEFKRICLSLEIKNYMIKAPYLRKGTTLKLSNKIENREVHKDYKSYVQAVKKCQNPVDVFTVLLDGSVVICCYDHNAETYMGNIFNETVEEIYFGPNFSKYRKDILSGEIPSFCKKECLAYLYEGDVIES